MDKIEIREVKSKKDLKQFVNFPFTLFNGNKYWCPPIKTEEINLLRKDRNPAFEYCDADYWMAFKNGKPAGRIAGIINPKANERWNVKLARFGWLDFIDDPEVSLRLFETVIQWARSKGMTGFHGPLGFTDFDAQGMLIEGYNEISSMSALYNYPYYVDHMWKLGFRKSVDWVQFEMKVPDKVPEKVNRITKIALQKYNLRLLEARNRKELRPYTQKLFSLYNRVFNEIYGFNALSQKQIDHYIRMYFGYIRTEFLSLVIDEKDDVVGFGISIPCLAKAMQKANGSLFPFGFIHLLRAMRKNDTIHMYLIGVHSDYHGKGLLALIYNDLTRAYIEAGMKIAHTHPQLEENLKAISIWKNYDNRIYIRRRCWILDDFNGFNPANPANPVIL